MGYVLRDYQVKASDAAVKFFNDKKNERNGILVLPTGCHAKGTKIICADGSLKPVEDVVVGDLLLGVTGYRKVLKLHRGTDDMYRIIPNKGKPFVVNKGHILHLYKTNEGKNYPSCYPRYDDITVEEYLQKSANYKHLHKLCRVGLCAFDTSSQQLEVEPYMLGLLIGDGYIKNGDVNITTMREEVKNYIYEYASQYCYSVRDDYKGGDNKAHTYHILSRQGNIGLMKERLVKEGIYGKTAESKFIPQQYLTASVDQRLELLAGLLDTDSHYSKEKNYHEYSTKSKQLMEDVRFLSRSLGFMCEDKEKIVNGVTYYRLTISGDLNTIPNKVEIRKGSERKQKKSVLVTGFSVEYVGNGDYYGFTLDGDHLYCDEQFFIHHNSGKSIIVADIAHKLNQNVLVLQPSKEILKQNYAKYRSYGLDNCSIYSASFNSKEISEVTFATIGSIMAHIDDFDHFKAIIIDECHGVNPVEGQYATFIRKVKRKVLGLTATPYRLATAQGIETKEKGFMPNGSYKTSDYFIDDFHPMPGVTLKNACILKFITRTRPRIFHDVLYEVSIQTLLQRGYLANLRYFDMTTIDTSRVKRNSTGRDYDEQSLSEEFSRCGLGNQLSDIVKRLLHPKNGVPRKGILVFTQFITESEQLAREVEGVAVVTGATKSKERDRILEDFKSGKIKVLANVGVLTCLSADTEILTKNKGWVGINDIDSSDMVAQYDANTEVIDFAHPQRIIKKEFEEDFVSIEGRYMNFKVTHDHNMLFRRRVENHLGVPRRCKALELVSESRPYIPVSGYASVDIIVVPQDKRCSDKRFLATNSYNYRKRGMSKEEAQDIAHKMLKLRNSRRYKNPNELTFDECRFIGFWLGDGSLYKSKDGRRYSVSQSCCNPLMIEWVENILEKCGIHYNKQYYTASDDVAILGQKCHVSDHISYNLALGTGGNKQNVESNLYSLLPYLQKSGSNLYWGLNREQFFCLMEGYFKANGDHGNNRIYTGQASVGANKELFDLLQAIGVCRGYRVTIRKQQDREHTKKTLYKISMGDYRYHQMVRDKAKIVPNKSKEQVWCVTMPKGTIVTRRNGRVTIMGNCGFDYPELDTVVMARPTMSLAMWYQIVGRAIRPFEGKDGWIVDLGENIKRFGKVDDLTLKEDRPGQYYISGVVNGQYKPLTNVYF